MFAIQQFLENLNAVEFQLFGLMMSGQKNVNSQSIQIIECSYYWDSTELAVLTKKSEKRNW